MAIIRMISQTGLNWEAAVLNESSFGRGPNCSLRVELPGIPPCIGTLHLADGKWWLNIQDESQIAVDDQQGSSLHLTHGSLIRVLRSGIVFCFLDEDLPPSGQDLPDNFQKTPAHSRDNTLVSTGRRPSLEVGVDDAGRFVSSLSSLNSGALTPHNVPSPPTIGDANFTPAYDSPLKMETSATPGPGLFSPREPQITPPRDRVRTDTYRLPWFSVTLVAACVGAANGILVFVWMSTRAHPGPQVNAAADGRGPVLSPSPTVIVADPSVLPSATEVSREPLPDVENETNQPLARAKTYETDARPIPRRTDAPDTRHEKPESPSVPPNLIQAEALPEVLLPAPTTLAEIKVTSDVPLSLKIDSAAPVRTPYNGKIPCGKRRIAILDAAQQRWLIQDFDVPESGMRMRIDLNTRTITANGKFLGVFQNSRPGINGAHAEQW